MVLATSFKRRRDWLDLALVDVSKIMMSYDEKRGKDYFLFL